MTYSAVIFFLFFYVCWRYIVFFSSLRNYLIEKNIFEHFLKWLLSNWHELLNRAAASYVWIPFCLSCVFGKLYIHRFITEVITYKAIIWQHKWDNAECSTSYQLTHWGRDKMDAISQTTSSSAFSWMKMFEFRLKCQWSLFLRAQLTIFQHWFR